MQVQTGETNGKEEKERRRDVRCARIRWLVRDGGDSPHGYRATHVKKPSQGAAAASDGANHACDAIGNRCMRRRRGPEPPDGRRQRTQHTLLFPGGPSLPDLTSTRMRQDQKYSSESGWTDSGRRKSEMMGEYIGLVYIVVDAVCLRLG